MYVQNNVAHDDFEELKNRTFPDMSQETKYRRRARNPHDQSNPDLTSFKSLNDSTTTSQEVLFETVTPNYPTVNRSELRRYSATWKDHTAEDLKLPEIDDNTPVNRSLAPVMLKPRSDLRKTANPLPPVISSVDPIQRSFPRATKSRSSDEEEEILLNSGDETNDYFESVPKEQRSNSLSAASFSSTKQRGRDTPSVSVAQSILECPLCFQLFEVPVVAEDGHTYEEHEIIKWIKKNGTSPLTNEPISIKGLRPNHLVRKIIDEFQSAVQTRSYQFELNVDVAKGPRALYQTAGKMIFEARWLKNIDGPLIVLMKVHGLRAVRESQFYFELSCHPHILRTYGIVVDPTQHSSSDSMMLLQERAPKSNLNELLEDVKEFPAEVVVLEIFIQITDAMSFLAHNRVVHGDLACRNILVFRFHPHRSDYNHVKLTDFGLSRGSSLYLSIDSSPCTSNVIPVRYAAPEVLMGSENCHSEMSDIFSMGVLMWETCSKGALPWAKVEKDSEIIRKVTNGDRLRRPQHCSDKLWNIILKQCMAHKPADRPTFDKLKENLQDLQFSMKGSDNVKKNRRLHT
ncbi:unnamed protein product [Didymodactylos carnosus]|uniref:Non-specific protein-tyrosine kinase n=1 Tax=Didymodactylos carnosus TaxID=1234261 RepID=A0A815P5X0_9BILA|nr:unnamed protein product [Didymodactylos carnosus]CAF4319712.1 unnamed protein product [Didymodactylos carnosus]